MKKVKLLLVSLCLLFVSISVLGMVNTRTVIKVQKKLTSSESSKKTIPIELDIACYLDNNSVELIVEGNNVSLDVQIINTSTNEIVYEGPVECMDGVSTYIPDTFEEGSYYISLSISNTIWEGTFDIY